MFGYNTLSFIINISYIFQTAANFLTFIFHKVVWRHIYGTVKHVNMSLLQIYRWVCQRKNLENQLVFGEVMDKSLVSCFLTHGVAGV